MSSHGSGAPEGAAADFFGNERFELEERLGEGAYGVVYQALDRVRDARVALKVLRRLRPDALFYFKREFRALADIQHPNLVRYYELFEERGNWFLTMELLRGASFIEHVRAGRSPIDQKEARFDEERLRRALPQLVAALTALHAADKVHRDVKPSNVRVTPAGRVVLLDFGLVLDTDARESTRLPRVGTVAFMAPEQVLGAQVGPEADYYAVGAMIYECLTGRHPFIGDAYEVLSDKQAHDPPAPSSVAPCVPLDLEELSIALLAREPSARTSGIEALLELLPRGPSRVSVSMPAPRAPKSAGFVGRARELSVLIRLLGQLEEGQARVCFVAGESGVGKSALLGEFAQKAREERPDVVVLRGRCYERETVPYKAFDGVIDALARHLRRLPDDDVLLLLPQGVEVLAQVFPVLERVPRIRDRMAKERMVREPADGPHARRRAFSALRSLLQRIAANAPLVIAIDDVHRADVDSMALLEELVLSSDMPALFVLVGRASPRRDEARVESEDPLWFLSHDEARPRGAEGEGRTAEATLKLERLLARAPNLLRLRLGPLAEVDATRLAEAQLGEQGGPEELAPLIAREAFGQPLFVATLVHFVCQSASRALPTLDEVVRSSVDALSAKAQELVATVAVAGAPLARDVLSRALKLHGDALQRAIDEAMATQWFHVSSSEDGSGLELVHDRVREALLSRLGSEQKWATHRALAEALSRTHANSEAAALHWAEAGASDEVTTYARSAARQAVASLAFGKAIRLYELALSHVDHAQVDLTIELTEALGEALSFASRSQESAECFGEAARLCSSEEKALTLRYRTASEWLLAGDTGRGVRELEQLLGQLGVELPATRRQVALSRHARRAWAFLRGVRWEARDESELSLAERLRLDVLWSLCTALMGVDMLRALELQARHLSFALAGSDAYRLSRAFALEAWFEPRRGARSDVFGGEELRLAKELAREAAHPHAAALLELVHAALFQQMGRHRDAIRHAESADARLREECRGVLWERKEAQLIALGSRFELGDFRGVSERLRSAMREAEDRADRTLALSLAARFSAWEELLGDEPDQARSLLERLSRQVSSGSFGSQAFDLLSAHTEVDLYQGDPNASARVERAWPLLEQSYLLRAGSLRLRAPFLRARAALGSAYLMPHQRGPLLSLAQQCAARIERERSEVAHACSAMISAAVLELRGERAAAVATFGEAALGAEGSGMTHYGAVLRRRQGTVLGGEEGRAMIVRAERQLREQGAVDPGRVCALLLGY